ncbi:MAG: coproporphyrinogen dehydrogenase HemZ [Clostridia bacterium]|nr:coproporphyrinogen dehydrogenase HemZ [Clostridia bacterium]
MILRVLGHSFHYECENLCRVFFPNEKIVTRRDREGADARTVDTILAAAPDGISLTVTAELDGAAAQRSDCLPADAEKDACELRMAQLLFDVMCTLTGYVPPWGVLTGVRPSKLMLRLAGAQGEDAAFRYFTQDLLVSPEKARLALTVAKAEDAIVALSQPNSFSLYVSIPFCPSRCSYCSFVSHSIGNANARKLLIPYLEKLALELQAIGRLHRELGLRLESVYFGGGTPGVLEAPQLDRLLTEIEQSFDCTTLRETTVEIGRPDTVTPEKLHVLRLHNVGRISINPQTYHQATLDRIGRQHTVAEALKAYRLAAGCGFDCINTDLIAGLPGETPEMFRQSLDTAISLGGGNITIHALALKRSSALNADGGGVADGNAAKEMLAYAAETLPAAGYAPYYMYRQSKCVGNLENVGWTRPGQACLYNVFMMEECHTVLAAGAGGVTKLCEYRGTNVERIYNYKYPYEYISGFEQLLDRKNGIKQFYETYRI